jgi:hypothetical protein
MVIIKLQGGLGNQMFQFAAAFVLAKKRQTDLYLDLNLYTKKNAQKLITPREYELNIFNLPGKILTKREIKKIQNNKDFRLPIWKLNNKLAYTIYTEIPYVYDENLYDVEPPIYLDGYFQSYKYFDDHKDLIQSLFDFERKMNHERVSENLYNIINDESVSVHIRRGDYVTDKQTNEHHGTCHIDYYEKSIDLMLKEFNNPHFFFFSDDIAWAKEKFSNLKAKKTFVKENIETDSWKDMFFMTKCKHNVIANSSFSWWGAWLNQNKEKKVIAPQKWLRFNTSLEDLIPCSWIKL